MRNTYIDPRLRGSGDVVGDQHDWELSGLCRTEPDPEIFFPETSGTPWLAKSVCRRCPVRAQCLTTALVRDEPVGVWGGLTARERRKLVKRRGLLTAFGR
jgi:WhiB family redox-sensing transcriptional regulator